MNSLLSLDSHFLFFDEAEKEIFDIDSFLSPSYDIVPPLEAVLGTPVSSPNNKQTIESNNDGSMFQNDNPVPKLRRKKRYDSRLNKSEVNNYIKDLEKRVSELLNENIKLKESVYSLTTDKERLENEVLQIRRSNSSQDGKDLRKEPLEQEVLSSNKHLDIKSNSSSTVLLMILLLSFSLLCHNTATADRFDIPTNRSTSDLKDNTQFPSPNISIKVEKHTGTPQQKTTKRVLRHEKNSNNSRTVKKRKDQKTNNKTSIPTSLHTPSTFDHRSIIPHITQWKPNTTYLLCHNVSQIVPPSHIHTEEPQLSTLSFISFIIPPDILGARQQDHSLLEVICQVMTVNFVPIRI